MHGMIKRLLSYRKSIKIRYLLLAASIGLVVICSGFYIGVSSYAPLAPVAYITMTPTPFLPAPFTVTPYEWNQAGTDSGATPAPLATPTETPPAPAWAPYAGPIYPALTEIPTPAQEFPDSENILNIAILGSDERPYGGGFNTDTIMILTLNRNLKTASLVSFPRDLYVYIPGYGMDRINSAWGHGVTISYQCGGFCLFQDTLKYNFGITVHHYAMVNFALFKKLIDDMGGIDVYSAYGLTDRRSGYKEDYSLPAGWNHMDGETALWYVRSRATSSDYDRVRRQQEVLLGMEHTLLSRNALTDIPGYFVTLHDYVISDLTLETVMPFFDVAVSVAQSTVQRETFVPPTYGRDWYTPDGKAVDLPNYENIHAYLAAILSV
jgi:LCP family protein required for cell wall assembly